MNIFLIGFMGCGKSRKGRELAKKLGWEFVDLDAEMELQMNMSINAYFGQFGEAAFRQLESETLKQLTAEKNRVVATGGGLPCFYDNMQWMNAHGKTVYLKMLPEALVSRLAKREKRPLIKDLDDAALLHFIKDKLAERSAYYEQAHLILNGLDLNASDLIHHLNLK